MFRSPHSEGAGLWADSRGEEGQWTRSTARLSLLLLLLLLLLAIYSNLLITISESVGSS